ncbi:TIGR01244 family sulfur transferase [uncultured Sphingomonas sp.]|uniref:TIGR01244 family sulfur transferase n=1 Tax=uncultured Sphingomonas sp. TaxID=158754 RepID=UPI0035CC662B
MTDISDIRLPDIRRIDDRISVAPQVTPAMIAAVKAAGFVGIVNNRPDDEEPGQPSGAAVRAAAEAAGLSYAEIPVTHAGFSHPQLDAMARVLAEADGPVLAFCRSGTRSCNLWALARAKAGADPTGLVAQGAAAGYDLGGIRPTLDALAAG